jgi:putative ABC transport system substrate-binding protein
MKRRELMLLLIGSTVIAARVVRAQQKAMPVIGFLSSASPGPFAPFVAAFHWGLSETGYVEGQNVIIEYRWAENHSDQLSALADDLVGRGVDVIVSSGSVSAALAAKGATLTIPIVFTGISDPVAAGLVASLARPGGNLTGSSPFQFELMPKRLELLTELVPQAREIALLVNPDDPRAEGLIGDMREAARVRGCSFIS